MRLAVAAEAVAGDDGDAGVRAQFEQAVVGVRQLLDQAAVHPAAEQPDVGGIGELPPSAEPQTGIGDQIQLDVRIPGELLRGVHQQPQPAQRALTGFAQRAVAHDVGQVHQEAGRAEVRGEVVLHRGSPSRMPCTEADGM